MKIYYSIVFFLFGTIFGSFFQVVGSRLPKGESIVSPPSHCTNCNHRLTWIELIPILSYLIQGGKCRQCKQKISLFYPIFEFTTGLFFALAYLTIGIHFELVIALSVISILLILIVSDYEYMILPDEVLLVGSVLLVIEYLFFYGYRFTLWAVMDGILASLLMYVIKLWGDWMFKKESMGGGDIKLMFFIGMVLGFFTSVITIFFASFIALPISCVILYEKKSHIIPFGPFLSITTILFHLTQFDVDALVRILLH